MQIFSELLAIGYQSIDIVLHLDQYMSVWVTDLGSLIYVAVFLIILGETGIIALPFLPGDSLLFALGALTITSPELRIDILIPTLVVAGILGGFVNYAFGSYVNTKVLLKEKKLWFNRSYLEKTQAFYEKYGTKTVFIARFIPVIRTFAPFVAGIARMEYRKFALVNIFGAIFWIFSMTYLGRLFGNIPLVKNNFGLVIPAIIVISVIPIAYEILKRKRRIAAEPSK